MFVNCLSLFLGFTFYFLFRIYCLFFLETGYAVFEENCGDGCEQKLYVILVLIILIAPFYGVFLSTDFGGDVV